MRMTCPLCKRRFEINFLRGSRWGWNADCPKCGKVMDVRIPYKADACFSELEKLAAEKFADDLLGKIDRTILEGEYETWNEMSVEMNMRTPFPEGYVMSVHGERTLFYEEADQEPKFHDTYSVYISEKRGEYEMTATTSSVRRADLHFAIQDSLDAFMKLKKMEEQESKKRQRRKCRRKYRRGGHILSLDELSKQEFVYWNDKVTHRGWLMNWQFSMAYKAVGEKGCVYYAVRVNQEDADSIESDVSSPYASACG